MRSLLLTSVALVAGCAVDADVPDADCSEDRCVAADSRDELLAALEGFEDPVASFLRRAVSEQGTLAGDYRAILDGVGAELGCDPAAERGFVVLSNDGFVPKPILAHCTDDAIAASRFLVAMVGDETGMHRDVVHLAAWDDAAGVYRRYATSPRDGEMAINVQPTFCLGCHGGPEKLDTWVPLMNEMASPWSNWNAHPGFASQLFDEHLAPQYAQDPTYQEVTRVGYLDSAAAFEPIVRAGIARVTGARLKQRTEAADVARALELVRPLFCDESVNYVSEVHDSGELRSAALVDDAIRSLYRSAGIAGDWSWLVDTRLHLPAPAGGEAPVTLIPVRGESTLQTELGLVARGALPARTALRVRALDWTHPVQSELRCSLYRQGKARLEAQGLALDGAATTADLLPRVVDELLTLEVAGRRVPLVPATGDVIAIPDAGDPAAQAALASGELDAYAMTLADLGGAIEAHLVGFQAAPMRPVLARERDRRACRAVAQTPTAPLYTDVTCE